MPANHQLSDQGRIWLWVSCLWGGVIFYGSTATAERLCITVLESFLSLFAPAAGIDDGTHPDYFWVKKTVHVVLFVIFAFCLSRAAVFGSTLGIGSILLIGVLVGATTECIQFLFPTREPTARDFCINVTATLCGALVFQRRGVLTEEGVRI